jgi:hypothetical protein
MAGHLAEGQAAGCCEVRDEPSADLRALQDAGDRAAQEYFAVPPTAARPDARRLRHNRAAQFLPSPGLCVTIADCSDWRRPGDCQVGVVISHAEILGRVMGAVDAVADIREVGEHLVTMQHPGRHIEMPELLVVEEECRVPAKGRRARPCVDEDVENGAVGAPDKLGLAATGTTMESTEHAAFGPGLRVLHERRAVDPVFGSDRRVEGACEEPAVVVIRRRDEDQDTGKGRCADLHGVILTSADQFA